MAITFYFAPNSTANTTSAVLAELEHGRKEPLVTRVELSFKSGDLKTPSYLAMNPNGKVPLIVHDGVSIWESAAITMYLGELYGAGSDERGDEHASLYPKLGPLRGEAMKWIVWCNVNLSTVGTQVGEAFMAVMAGGEEAPSGEAQAKMEVAKKAASELLKVLDGAMGAEYLLGKNYSLVDTHLWTVLRWLQMMQIDISPYHNLTEWTSKVEKRQAIKEWASTH